MTECVAEKPAREPSTAALIIRDSLALPVSRRAFLRGAAAASAAGATLVALGCGSGVDAPSGTPTQGPGAIQQPALLTSDFIAGMDNRFVIGLVDAKKDLVRGAGVHARFFTLSEQMLGRFRGEGDLQYVELNVEGAHVHDSSAEEAQHDDRVGFYVANTAFDVAGQWGAELAISPPEGGGEPARVQVTFGVQAQSTAPTAGVAAPPSRNDTIATNPDTRKLCSRDPICGLHDKVIADLVGRGRPLVVQFSTPAFCTTRFCGPVLEVLLAEMPPYQDRVDFIHIEVYEDFEEDRRRPAVGEWGLQTEPWTFFVGRDGRVVGRLEAVFSEEELRQQLERLLSA